MDILNDSGNLRKLRRNQMKCDIWLSNEEVRNLERGGFITMKLAEFVLKLISLGVGVHFGRSILDMMYIA